MATLYDFLYIDNERVKFIYAQLFSGLLDAIEDVASERTTQTSSGRAGGSPVGHLEHSTQTSEEESRLEQIDPHDLILKDVLQKLNEYDMIKHDDRSALVGNFVLLNGKISILDFGNYQYFIDILPGLIQSEATQKQGKDSKKDSKQKENEEIKSFLQLMSNIVPWSIQLIISSENLLGWGAINSNNLRDDPGNLMLKHGPTLVGNWYMLGIVDALDSQFGQTSASYPQTISGLMQANDTIRETFGRPQHFVGITPLMVFRKLV